MRTISELLRDQAAALRRIAGATRGDMIVEDVKQEAWLVAADIERRRGYPVDFSDPGDQESVLKWLYCKLVKFAEKQMRHAVRIDKNWDQEEADVAASALARLAALTIQNISRWCFWTTGMPHTAPGSQTCILMYRRRNARPRKTSVAPMNKGRIGSSAVRWATHAPAIPRARGTSDDPTICLCLSPPVVHKIGVQALGHGHLGHRRARRRALRQHLPLQLRAVPAVRSRHGVRLGVHFTSLVDSILADQSGAFKTGSPDAYRARAHCPCRHTSSRHGAAAAWETAADAAAITARLGGCARGRRQRPQTSWRRNLGAAARGSRPRRAAPP